MIGKQKPEKEKGAQSPTGRPCALALRREGINPASGLYSGSVSGGTTLIQGMRSGLLVVYTPQAPEKQLLAEESTWLICEN
jgi:hypothetical protein